MPVQVGTPLPGFIVFLIGEMFGLGPNLYPCFFLPKLLFVFCFPIQGFSMVEMFYFFGFSGPPTQLPIKPTEAYSYL